MFMNRLTALALTAIVGSSAVSAQGFFSVSAGTDGFNLNMGAVSPLLMEPDHRPNPLLMVPVRGHHHDYYYDDDDYDGDIVVVHPAHHSKKYYKKAAKRYRKALKHARRHSRDSWGVMLTPNGIVVGGSGVPVAVPYYDYDDDDIEDFIEDMYEHHHKVKKHHKKYYKHYKKKHHHHDDDNDDDD